jgi:muramoyltetrapeptide carboxypeptidase
MEMIRDEQVKAIFFVRGGWGCARVMEYLDFDVIKANPKIIMGFSDISTLLNAITLKTGLITFHGPNGNASWNGRTRNWIEQLFFRGEQTSFSNGETDEPFRTINKGTAEGELFGGNLSVVSSLMGTSYLPDWAGKILFLEDVKEEPYRIDRMLTQLKLNGVFDKVSGIVLGRFRDCVAEEKERSFTVDQVFEQHFRGLGKPVLSGAQFGHVVEKFILPVGAKVLMNADTGTLQLLHEVVMKKYIEILFIV